MFVKRRTCCWLNWSCFLGRVTFEMAGDRVGSSHVRSGMHEAGWAESQLRPLGVVSVRFK